MSLVWAPGIFHPGSCSVNHRLSFSVLGCASLLCAGACAKNDPPPPSDPVATPAVPLPSDPHTPRRLRRLTHDELENVLADVLGARLDLTRGFLPDPRVDGYDDDA